MKAVKRKTIDDVLFRNEYEALKVLEDFVEKLVREDFGNDLNVRTYVRRRFEGAREVLRRASKDYVALSELRSMVMTGEATEKGILRQVKMKTLDGREVIVERGVPDEEAWYHVRVSRYRLKCTCKDAVMLSSLADRNLKNALRRARVKRFPTAEPVFYRYVLCKHTLAKIAKAMSAGEAGVLNVDREFADTLRIALFAVYLKVVENPDPEVVRRAYRILRRRLRA